jgi:hypothetical protein
MATFKVVAHLPATVRLSRRTTKETITVEVSGGTRPGKLVISQGTIEWWPGGQSVNIYRTHWQHFAEICEEHVPKRRSVSKSKRPKK